MALVKVKTWIEENFREDSRPDPRTIFAAIEAGDLEGIKIGRQYWIEDNEERIEEIIEI